MRKKAGFIYLLIIIAGSFLAGCATTQEETVSERPWNAPKSWENGIPGGMMQGR